MSSSTESSATDVVSVVIPAYQAEELLGSTLRSVLDQTHRALEVILVDDGSSDATPEIIARAAIDPRVVPVSYGGNRGRSHARNAGIDRATGRWVCFVDADDLLPPDRFERLVSAARQHPESRVVTDDRIGFTVDAAGVHLGHRYPSRRTIRVGSVHAIERRTHFSDKWCHHDAIIDREYLLRTGIRFPERLSIGEDLSFATAILFAHPEPHAIRVGEVGYYYRLADTSRARGGADAWLHAVDVAVEQTGSAELRALADRWQPVHSFANNFFDDRLEAAGRLRHRDVPPDPRVSPNPVTGWSWILFMKAVHDLSKIADRSRRDGIRNDISAQLHRTL